MKFYVKTMAYLLVLLLFSTNAVIEGAVTIMKDESIQIRCFNQDETIESFPKLNKTEPTKVDILYCPPPKVSYLAALQNLNIGTNYLKSLHITVMDIIDKEFVNGKKKSIQYATIITETTARFAYFVAFIDTKGEPQMTSIGKMCEGDMHLNLSTILPYQTINTKQVTFSLSCPGQNFPYIDLFKKFNIDYNLIERLELKYFVFHSKINATVLNGLSLSELSINKAGVIADIEDGFFDSQSKTLKILEVYRVNLKPLPDNIITKAVLIGAKSHDVFGGCESLEKMEVTQWTVGLNTGWLEKCPKLWDLVLKQMTEENIIRALGEVKLLTSLTVQNAAMIRLSENLLENLILLKNLTIAKVRLQNIDSKAFRKTIQLDRVDLSGNVLNSGFELISAVADTKSITVLDASNNQNLNLCVERNSEIVHQYKVLPPLKRLYLNFTGMTHMCFRHFKHLTYLDLSKNNIQRLNFKDLPTYDNQSLEVNLEKNPVTIPDSEEDYKLMVEKIKRVKNLTIHVDIPLDCDCKHAWYAKALRALPQLNVDANCFQGSPKTVSLEPLECTKKNCFPCTCRTSWMNNETSADCKDRVLKTTPVLGNVTAVVVSNNLIHALKEEDFRANIISLDLRRNYISGVPREIVPRMFDNGREFWLSGNPILCDCQNQEFIFALQTYRTQVKDFAQLTCADGTTPIKAVDGFGLCEAEKERRVLVTAAFIGIFLALIAFCGVLCYRYWREVKVYLFARGLCMWWLKEDSLDSNKLFDAFISFSHQDEEFVATQLLPNLENNYAICLHTRNWIPGEMISTQIVRSVEVSRRTIIVLSRNFLNSVWGMMEFKTAHISALREGRARVIILVLDEVITDENIDEELRRYLKTNTYLKWGDVLFWDKLKYALPHYPRKKVADDDKEEEMVTSHISTPYSTSGL